MTRLIPAWMAPWKCWACGARHSFLWDICEWTMTPRGER